MANTGALDQFHRAKAVPGVGRREFITLVGGAAAAWPLSARAQQTARPEIGFLGTRSAKADASHVAAFRKGLNETGYDEGKNLAVEYRWADGQYHQLPALAADLVRRPVTIIVTTGGFTSASAAKLATTTIPIVFQTDSDPVRDGLVTSLNRPGANITGVTSFALMLGAKRLDLLRAIVPNAALITLLVNPTNPSTDEQLRDLREVARTISLQIQIVKASSERELETVFGTIVRLQADALLITTDAFFTSRHEQLAELALRHAVPAIHAWREFAEAGGLMSYGSRQTDEYRQAGLYAGQIINGTKPADLPVQQPTKFELVINLKTAKALGLEVPAKLLARADEVIE